MNPPARRGVGPALADADAAVHGRGEVAAVVARRRSRRRRRCGSARRAGAGRRRAAAGRTTTPGFSRSVGSKQALEPLEQRDRLGGVHERQQLASGPGRRRARRTATRRARRRGRPASVRNGAQHGRRTVVQREVDAHVHAAVAEVPVGQAVDAVRRHERLEARAGSRPSRSGGTAASSQPGHACAPDGVRPARPAPSSRIRHSAVASGPGGTTADRVGAGVGGEPAARPRAPRPRRSRRRPRPAASRRPAGRAGHGRGALVRGAPRRPGGRRCPRRRAGRAAAGPGRRRPRWPCRGSRARRARSPGRHGDQADRRAEDDRRSVPSVPTRALARSRAVLGQQVLQGVAGHLPAEAAELGAQQRRGARRRARAGPARGRSSSPAPAVNRRPVPSTTSSATHVVGGAAVGDRVRAAGVVADHPAERAAGLGGRVGPEAQPVRARPRAAGSDRTTPGSTRAVRASGSTSRIRCEVPEKSRTTPVPTALPATEVPPPRAVIGTPASRATVERGEHVVDVRGNDHDLRARRGSSRRRWSTRRDGGWSRRRRRASRSAGRRRGRGGRRRGGPRRSGRGSRSTPPQSPTAAGTPAPRGAAAAAGRDVPHPTREARGGDVAPGWGWSGRSTTARDRGGGWTAARDPASG